MTGPAPILDRLRRLDTGTLSDAMDAIGLPPSVSGLHRQSGGTMLVGLVSTVTLVAGPAPAGAPKVHLCARAIDGAAPGTVIVVSHPGLDAGGWGGVLSLAAQCAGVAGAIVDGPTRDVDEAAALGFPIFARGTTSRTARGRVHEAATDAPIEVGGVAVQAGDFVAADGSGVVFIPAGRIGEALAAAERIAAKEQLMATAIREGRAVSAVMGADYEDMLRQVA